MEVFQRYWRLGLDLINHFGRTFNSQSSISSRSTSIIECAHRSSPISSDNPGLCSPCSDSEICSPRDSASWMELELSLTSNYLGWSSNNEFWNRALLRNLQCLFPRYQQIAHLHYANLALRITSPLATRDVAWLASGNSLSQSARPSSFSKCGDLDQWKSTERFAVDWNLDLEFINNPAWGLYIHLARAGICGANLR